MALIVTIANAEYLSDVGFGDFCIEPLKLELNRKQKDTAGEFYFDLFDETIFRVIKIENNEKIPQYVFTIEGRKIEEFNEMCNYHQTSNKSHFTQQKAISLPTETGRITMTKNKLTLTENSVSKTILINNENEFQKHLLRHFNIRSI